jgi:excisionase family DNA binding protein
MQQMSLPIIEPALLSIPDAALRLGVSRATIYRLLADGELDGPHVRAGRRVTADSIKRYLDRIDARARDGG